MIKANNRVAMYARFSSDNQRTESIDAQIRAMKQYCEQNHYVIVETYIDEAKSATTDRRPSFQRMIADSKKHLFDIVLVHKLDRFARNRYDSAVYKRELKKNGVTVYSVLENLDDSPESIMLQAVLEGMSEYYSENLGREVMKGMKETALQCKHTGGKPPLGFDVDPATKRLVINEDEAETVRLIFRMYNDGYVYNAILNELNRLKKRTKNGKRFLKSSFLSILQNKKYTGVYVFNKSSSKSADGTRNSHLYKDIEDQIIIPGGCPQIISVEDFNKAQMVRSSKQYKSYRTVSKEVHLLTGMIFCQDCGRAMVSASSTIRRNGKEYAPYNCYFCATRYTCSRKAIKREYLEIYVISLLEKHVFNRPAMKRIVKAIKAECISGSDEMLKRMKVIDKQLNEINKKLENCTSAIAKGIISQTLVEQVNSLEEQKIQLETQKKQLEISSSINPDSINIDDILSRYRKLRKAVSGYSYTQEYRAFIFNYITRITVGMHDITVILRTGLGLFDKLDTEYSISRYELYTTMREKA